MKRYDEDGNPYGVAHYIKVALKALIILIAIAIIALFIFRKQMMNDKGDMEKLIWTEEAVAAYNTSPEDFSVRSIYDYNTKDTNNIFNVSATRYIPSACELQFTIRSNEATLSRAILETYGVDITAAPDDEIFVFALRDDKGNMYTEYEYVTEIHNIYKYRRLVFSGIDLNQCTEVTLMAYCTLDGIPGEFTYCDTVKIYDAIHLTRIYDYSKELPKDVRPTEGVKAYSFNFGEELPPFED